MNQPSFFDVDTDTAPMDDVSSGEPLAQPQAPLLSIGTVNPATRGAVGVDVGESSCDNELLPGPPVQLPTHKAQSVRQPGGMDEGKVGSSSYHPTVERTLYMNQIARDMAVLKEDPIYWVPSREFYEQRIKLYREVLS